MKKIIMLLFSVLLLAAGCGKEKFFNSGYVFESVPASGGLVVVTVVSNTGWDVLGESSWCRPDRRSGSDIEDVLFSVDPNQTFQDRRCSFTVSSKDGSILVDIFQSKKSNESTLTFTPAYNQTQVSTGVAKIQGMSVVIDPEYASWITEVPVAVGAEIKVNIGINEGIDLRTGEFEIRNSATSEIIHCIVRQSSRLWTSEEGKTFLIEEQQGATFSTAYPSSGNYLIVVPQTNADWILPVSGSDPVSLRVTACNEKGIRSGYFEVYDKAAGKVYLHRVQQLGAADYTYRCPVAGQTITGLEMGPNQIMAISPEYRSWIEKGTGNTAIIKANETGEKRFGEFTTDDARHNTVVYIVIQEG